MSFDAGINFRTSLGFVTDGTNEVYCQGSSDPYPTTRGGFTFGWVTSSTVDTRDRDASNDRRLAGINFTPTVGDYFRLDLPSAGSYNVHAAAGDAGGSNAVEWQLQDGTTTFATLSGTPASDHFHDATNADRSNTAWPGSEVAVTQAFSTTQFRLRCNGSSNNVIAHIRVVTSSGGGGGGVFSWANYYYGTLLGSAG